MGRLIEEVRGDGPVRVANETNAVILSGGSQDYFQDSIMDSTNSYRIKEDQYHQTPRSFKRDGMISEACNLGAGNMVLYVSLFTNKMGQGENLPEISDGASMNENMDNDDGEMSELMDEDYGDLTGSSHEDEALSESWSSIFSGESNNDAPKLVSLLHHIPKKSVSDSNISPVNILFDGSLKPDMLATDSLVSSLNEDLRMTKLRSQDASAKGRLAVSNFMRALRVVKTSINRTSYSILSYPGHLSPGMTDVVSGPTFHEHHNRQRDLDDKCSHLEGPEVHEVHECAPGDSVHPALELPRGNKYRGRDSRMNSSFLRLYAIDYGARWSHILPNSYTSRELTYVINRTHASKKFHRRYNIISISNMSRDKLWDKVILPPRSDCAPRVCIDYSTYVYVGESNSKREPPVRSNSDAKAAGVLNSSRCFYNDQSPQAGNTKLQYTIKGWCNSRWLDCSKE